jgi:hypothetical protein
MKAPHEPNRIFAFVGTADSPKPVRLSDHAQEFLQYFFSSSSSAARLLVGQ